jgi:EAL domain-containing protein (putative c-di-GMP-specific phosphodiesterase class I)
VIPPGYFIDYVANSELMLPLGWWILNDSCRIAAAVVATGRPHFRVAVNVTGRQLTEPQFAEKFLATVECHGLLPSNLALEVTETVLICDGPEVAGTLQTLSDAGCVISLDDFGTGYSSLNHLRAIPVGALKIDISYTRRLLDCPATRTIVAAVHDLALNLGLLVIVEGVETIEQRDLLIEMGFTVGQGYLMARPCDEATFLAEYAPLVLTREAGGGSLSAFPEEGRFEVAEDQRSVPHLLDR